MGLVTYWMRLMGWGYWRSLPLGISVYLQPVFQSFSEVLGDRRFWGQSGSCSLQGPIDGMVLRFYPSIEGLEYGVHHWECGQ